jgi:hypothetical protein
MPSSCTIPVNLNPFRCKIFVEAFCLGDVFAVIIIFGSVVLAIEISCWQENDAIPCPSYSLNVP